MTGPSSTPRGEPKLQPGATWIPVREYVIPDDSPDFRHNRAERRQIERANRRRKKEN